MPPARRDVHKIDITGVDIVERQGGADEVHIGLIHRHPEQQPLQAGGPGVLPKLPHLEPTAMSSVEPQRTPARGTRSCSRSRSSWLKPNFRATGGAAHKSSKALASTRESASATSRLTRPAAGSAAAVIGRPAAPGADAQDARLEPLEYRVRTRRRSAERSSRCRGTSRRCRAARVRHRQQAGRRALPAAPPPDDRAVAGVELHALVISRGVVAPREGCPVSLRCRTAANRARMSAAVDSGAW